MQIVSLTVDRYSRYDNKAGQFKGIVELEGENGKQTLNLSMTSISAIFAVIRADAVEKARINAAATAQAVDNATNDPLLLGSSVEVAL